MYRIGMIEDEMSEASAIMLSLVENAKQLGEDSFQLYKLESKPDFREELLEEIEKDIKENNIQCLIVDYKLDTMHEVLEGMEIVTYFHDLLSEFPVIILTNVPEKGKKNDEADPDKVYSKPVFMKPDEEETKEMVYNIVRNMERYTRKRAELELQREQALDILVNESDQQDAVYYKLLDTERELSKYVPIEMNGIDEAYDMEDMDKALEALREYKSLLG